jgi:hypothetical protein
MCEDREESHVSGGKSEDFRSGEKTVGESESGREESRELGNNDSANFWARR